MNLWDVIADLSYKPGWKYTLNYRSTGRHSIWVTAKVQHSTTLEWVTFDFERMIPSSVLGDLAGFLTWIEDITLEAEFHELREFLKYKGELVNNPHASKPIESAAEPEVMKQRDDAAVAAKYQVKITVTGQIVNVKSKVSIRDEEAPLTGSGLLDEASVERLREYAITTVGDLAGVLEADIDSVASLLGKPTSELQDVKQRSLLRLADYRREEFEKQKGISYPLGALPPDL